MLGGAYRGSTPADDPGVSPLLAQDLSGLPPALVVTAGYDPLKDEGAAYAAALARAGVESELVDFPDCLHGFVGLARIYPEAAKSRAVIASFPAFISHNKAASTASGRKGSHHEVGAGGRSNRLADPFLDDRGGA